MIEHNKLLIYFVRTGMEQFDKYVIKKIKEKIN